MCGIVGVVANYPIKNLLYNALKGVQHRGQQAAGMATVDGSLMHLKKGIGLIRQAISAYDLTYLNGSAGIGHVRYPTAGAADDPEQAHPFYVNSPFGIMLAHNGNLTNIHSLRDEVLYTNHRHVRTKSDSEVLTNVFAFELEQLTTHKPLTNKAIFNAIYNLNRRLSGGYAVVSLIANYGLIAFRDPLGIRPLILGKKNESDNFISYMLASESCTLSSNGFEIVRDILPGEAVIITLDGKLESAMCYDNPSLNICIFEYVYLGRSDSIMEKVPLQAARYSMGKYLSKTIQDQYPDLAIDVVIPVPDIARTMAIAVAEALNKPYREGFVRNHLVDEDNYANNSSQFPVHAQLRLSPVELEFKNKNILIVDVSVVRGNISREIIQMARMSGAQKVYLASVAPKVQYSSVYGIAMPDSNELIAHNKTDQQVAAEIGADLLIYQNLDNLKRCIQEINPNLSHFEASCFDGNYITKNISLN